MASYRQEPDVCPNLVQYVKDLAPHFDEVIMLTNQRPISNAGELPASCTIRFVPNYCLDFGMWVRVLKHWKGPLKRLCLANDSCYIVGSLDPLFQHAQKHGWEFWGMSLSKETAEHVQSYFLVAEGDDTVNHMISFFKTMDNRRCGEFSKAKLVREYEVGLSRHMATRYPLNARFSMDQVSASWPWRYPVSNPTFYHWDALLAMGCPLLKKDHSSGPPLRRLACFVDKEYLPTVPMGTEVSIITMWVPLVALVVLALLGHRAR